jgi:hypothetical protein
MQPLPPFPERIKMIAVSMNMSNKVLCGSASNQLEASRSKSKLVSCKA